MGRFLAKDLRKGNAFVPKTIAEHEPMKTAPSTILTSRFNSLW
jgi:hypothetical protein